MYPGNTGAQGYSLFQSENKLSIFNCSIIEIDKENLPLDICAELKISDSWGRWKFNVEVNTKNSFDLKEIFNHVCGRKTSDDRDTLNTEFKKHPGILSFKEFSDKYKESFKREDYSYTFLISLTLHVEVDIPLVVMKKIDIQAPNSNKDDLVVKFTKRIVDRIYELIGN